jgi:hypothetical protein
LPFEPAGRVGQSEKNPTKELELVMNGWLNRELPRQITIPLTTPLIGSSRFVDVAAEKAYDLAVKEIDDFPGGTTRTLEKLDTTSLPTFLGDLAIAHENV